MIAPISDVPTPELKRIVILREHCAEVKQLFPVLDAMRRTKCLETDLDFFLG